jgi:hypothetical protein
MSCRYVFCVFCVVIPNQATVTSQRDAAEARAVALQDDLSDVRRQLSQLQTTLNNVLATHPWAVADHDHASVTAPLGLDDYEVRAEVLSSLCSVAMTLCRDCR